MQQQQQFECPFKETKRDGGWFTTRDNSAIAVTRAPAVAVLSLSYYTVVYYNSKWFYGENEKKKEFQMKDRRGSSISSYELSVKIRWTRTHNKKNQE